jgi:hypothetical protein
VLLGDAARDVVLHAGVGDGRARLRCSPQVGRGGQGLVGDADRGDGILSRVAIACNDHHHGLPRIADLVACQCVLRARCEETVVGDQQREPLREPVVEVLVRVDAEDALDPECPGDVDVDDASVGRLGAHERSLRRAVGEVVDVAPTPGDEATVLTALDRLPEDPRGHGARSLATAAACRTASTMPL